MASIHKRKKDKRFVYDVRWRDQSGVNRSRTVAAAAAANQLQGEIEDAIGSGRDWIPADLRAVPSLREAEEAYLKDRARDLSARTIHRYAQGLDLFGRFLTARDETQPRVSILQKRLLADFWDWLSAPENARHGHPRHRDSCRKVVEVVQLLWAWCFEDDAYHEHVRPPRKLTMPRRVPSLPVAPTWAQMDQVLQALDADCWQRRAALLARCTGLRRAELLALTWEDYQAGQLVIESDITKGGRRGRVVPVAPVLQAEIERWPRLGPTLVHAPELERTARGHIDRDLRRAWIRAKVPAHVWSGRPLHAFRKGFISGLRQAKADPDAVRYLVGHPVQGSHGAYVDPAMLPLAEAVKLVPAITA